MSNVKWIKLSTQMFEDEKIKLIEHMPDADTILIIWVKLLSQAGKANANGYIYLSENIPYTDEMLATIFGRPLNTVRMALEIFKQFGMIDIDDNHFINIENWEKHQNVAGLDKIREQTRKRVAKHRESQKVEPPKLDVTLPVTQGNATELELELDIELEKESNKEIVAKAPIRDLFDHYISKNIIRHSKVTSTMKTAVGARLKDYSYEQLMQAIDNYAIVYADDAYWFSTKYGFADLMRDKDVRKFIDDAEPLKNFLDNKFPNRGVKNATVGTSSPRNDAVQSKIDAANERRKRIAGIESNRDIDIPF